MMIDFTNIKEHQIDRPNGGSCLGAADDIVIFDESIQWCLSYWHEDELFFGKMNTTDPEIGYKEVEVMNEKEKKHPGYKHPLKNTEVKKK